MSSSSLRPVSPLKPRTGTRLNRSLPFLPSYNKPLPPHHPPTNKQATCRLRLLFGQRHKHQHNKRRREWLLLAGRNAAWFPSSRALSPSLFLSLPPFSSPKLFSCTVGMPERKSPLAACLLPARRLLRESCPAGEGRGRREGREAVG